MKLKLLLLVIFIAAFISCENKAQEDFKDAPDKIVFMNQKPQWKMEIPLYWNVVGRNEEVGTDTQSSRYILYLENDEGNNTFYTKILSNYRVSKDAWRLELPSLKRSVFNMAESQNVTVDTSTTQVRIGGADFDRFQILFLDSLGDTFKHRYLYTNYYQGGVFTARLDYGIGSDDRVQGKKMIEAFENSTFGNE